MSLFRNAIEHYSIAVTLEPDNVTWLLEFADILFLNQEFEKAVSTAKRALRIENKNKTIYERLYLFYGEIGNTKEQIKLLKKYLSYKKDAEFEALLKEIQSVKK